MNLYNLAGALQINASILLKKYQELFPNNISDYNTNLNENEIKELEKIFINNGVYGVKYLSFIRINTNKK